MQVNPLWPGALLALLAAAAQAGPRPAATPAPTPRPTVVAAAPQAVLLGGKPFPVVEPFVAQLPPPLRTLFVDAKAQSGGDGSDERPWSDLQSALCALQPGDRLRVRAGEYAGEFRIDETCRAGTAERPIQVFFDGRALLSPKGEAPVVTIRRPHWHLAGLFLELAQSPNTGVSLESGAAEVTLDQARIAGGAGPSVSVAGDAVRVRIANSRIAKTRLREANPAGVAIDVAAGAQDVWIVDNHLKDNPGGSIRIRPPEGEGPPASNVRILGNTIHDDATAAIDVAAASVIRIANNTISDAPGVSGTRGVSLGRASSASVQWNHISDCEIAVEVGRAGADGEARQAVDVSIDHNYIEDAFSVGTGVRIEAAKTARVVHNVLDRTAQPIVVRGAYPGTRAVTVANNLVIGVSSLAFVLDDPKSAPLFDYNLFSPTAGGGAPGVRVAGRELPLSTFLKEGTMPHTKVIPDVQILNRDLARIGGAAVVDQGTPLTGFKHRGAAPDIGVEQR